MLHKQEKNATRVGKAITGGALFTLILLACNFITPKTGADLTSPTTSPDILWRETQSPLFPINWPPTADTVWVRYTFAYGSNPSQLMDGNYVSNLLSKTEWQAGVESTTVLSKEISQAAIQGVVPLDEETQKILGNESQVSEYILKLTEMPDLQASETQEFLAYYRVWFKYNGAFLKLIRAEHGAFIEWVTQDD